MTSRSEVVELLLCAADLSLRRPPPGRYLFETLVLASAKEACGFSRVAYERACSAEIEATRLGQWETRHARLVETAQLLTEGRL